MSQFLSEIQEKYTKIVKSANLIGFLNRLAVLRTLTDSQPLDIEPIANVPITSQKECQIITKFFLKIRCMAQLNR